MKKLNALLPKVAAVLLLTTGSQIKAQLSGSYSVPGTYSTIASVINDLNQYGINGPVTINVAAGYTETAISGGYTLNAVAGTSSVNTVSFVKSGTGANPLIVAYTGSNTSASALQDGIWRFNGTDYVTIDGIDLLDQNTSNPGCMEFGYGFFKASAFDGCQYNTIKNCTITLNRLNNAAGSGPAVDGSRGIDVVNATMIAHTTAITVLVSTGSNSYNKFYSNVIQNCNYGIALIGFTDASPYSLADFGNDIGGSSAATGNAILNYGGGATTSAASGIRTLNQYSLNVSYNTINSNNGSGVNHGTTLRGIYINTAPGANVVISSNTVTVKGGGTTSSLTAIENAAGSTAASNLVTINNNLITGCTYTGATSGAFTGILSSSSSSSLAITGNTITGCSSSATSGTDPMIFNSGSVVNSININNNIISGMTFSGAMSGTFYGIYNTGGASTCSLSIISNNISGVSYAVAASSSHYFIYNSAATLAQLISNNQFTGMSLNTTGSVYFIYNSVSVSSIGLQAVTGNSIVLSFSKPGAGGTVYTYYTNASSSAGATITHTNNNFSNITLTGATTMGGWQNTDGGSPNKNISANTFTNWVCGTSAVTVMNLNYFGTTCSVSNNTISAISASAAITGISFGTSGTINTFSITGNVVTNLNVLTSGGITGLSIGGMSSTSLFVNGNTIGSFTTQGASSVVGISNAATQSSWIFQNRIFDLLANNSGGSVNGLAVSAGVKNNIYNNIIGDLRAPLAVAANPVIGMNLTGGTLNNVYFNSIYLNAASTGSLFGSSALYATTSSSLDLRNNILYNGSAPVGTGLTVAFRRSSTTLTSYLSTSDNNLFYAGTPGTSNLIMYDGTNSYQTLAAYQSALTNRDLHSATENVPFSNLISTSSSFLNISTSANTAVESGATYISTITVDYAGTARSLGPDIGAWEGSYLPSLTDVLAPSISNVGYTSNSCNLSQRTLTMNLTDASGIATGANTPLIYYKLNSGSYASTSGSLIGGSSTAGAWSFTLSYSGSLNDVISWFVVTADNSTNQNTSAYPSAGFVGSVTSVTTAPTSPLTYTLLGALNGTYAVGSAGTFTTLSIAANAYNTMCLTGPVTFSLTDALYSANETFPVTFLNNSQASATNSLLIVPASGTVVSVMQNSSTVTSVLKFLNSNYITINGSNGAGSGLNIINTNSTTASANVWLASDNGSSAGNKNFSVMNATLTGGSNLSSNGVISSIDGTSPSATSGYDNDNIKIQGCYFVNFYNGILAVGGASVSTLGLDNWSVLTNTFGPASTGTNNTGGSGVVLAAAVNATVSNNIIRFISTSSSGIYGINANTAINGLTISQNTITNLSSSAGSSSISSIAGIYLGSSVGNVTINANYLQTIVNTNTGGWGVRGITINSGLASANINVRNNMLSDIYNYADAGLSYNPMGITVENSTGGVNIDNNSVNLYGSHAGYTSGTSLAHCLYIGSSVGGLNVRNNIFSNTYDNSTSTTDISYAIYSAVAASNFSAIDYNDYYVGGTGNVPTLGYLGGGLSTLSAIQTSYGQNARSVNYQPGFTSSNDLHLLASSANNYYLDNTALVIAGINTDFDAQTRSLTTPDIGADEFSSSISCTAAIAPVVAATTQTICSTQTLSLLGTGANVGANSSYVWQVSSTSGGPYSNVTTGTGSTTSNYQATALTAGTYYFVMKSTCSGTTATSNEATVVVRSGGVPVISITPTVICGTGTATLTATGATSFTWNTGATTSSILVTPTLSGVYSVIGANSPCSAALSQFTALYYSALPTLSASSASTSVCAGMPTTLTASGASTYTWSTGNIGSTVNPTLSATSVLTVTGAKANGCSNTTTLSMAVNPAPSVFISGSSGICTGQNASLTANGAVTYSWNTGATASAIVTTPTATTVYTVTGYDALGCPAVAVNTVNVAASLSITIAGPSTMCIGQSTVLTGGGGVTYAWNTGAATNTIAVTPTLGVNSYSVIGSSGTCSNTALRTVTVYALPVVGITGTTALCVGQSAVLSANGASTYVWNTGATTSTLNVSPTVNTSYSVVGTSSLGCSSSSVYAVTANTVPVITVAANNLSVCATSAVIFTANGASTFTWTGGPVSANYTINPTVSGTYSVAGTNPAGCISGKTVAVVVYTLPVISIAPASATVCSQSPVTFTASGGQTYTWNTTFTGSVIQFTPSTSTTYTIAGTNGFGCVASTTVGVTTNTLPILSITPPAVTLCAQTATTFVASGASTYTWNNTTPGASVTLFNANSTTHTVTGTSAQGCVSQATVGVYANPRPTLTVTPTYTQACLNSNVTFSISGANTYTWNGGATGTSTTIAATGLTSYSASGTNTFGCTSSTNFVINVYALPVISVSPASSTVCANSPVTMTATGAGSYTWNGSAGSSTLIVTPGINTSYTVTGADPQTGCVGTASANVSVLALPTLTVASTPTALCIGSSATLVVSGASFYNWDNGFTTPTIAVTPTAATVYTVEGLDTLGCSSIKQFTLHVNSLPSVQISVLTPTICSGETASLSAGGAISYTWNGIVAGPSYTAVMLSNSIVKVAGVDANGCMGTDSKTVIVSKCTGIVSAHQDLMLNLYPNPSSGVVTLTDDGEREKQISVFDLTGRLIFHTSTSGKSEVIDLRDRAKGLYLVSVRVGAVVTSFRVVLQ